MSTLRAAVKLWNGRLGPGLFGLGCSGGADSIALADAAIAEMGAHNVVVIHVDHGLTPGSAAIGEEVCAWAREQGAAAVIRRVSVARGASVEARAREARYRAFTELLDELGLSWILLAHTARDQAETVLMRIVRGTGPAGLAGIPTLRPGFVRPLLEIPRETIDAYVAERGLPTWHDPMNDDPSIARVRFRTAILPALRAENPALDGALVRLAASAREWMSAIDELADPVARFPIDCARLVLLASAVRKRAVALALEAAGLGYDASHLEHIDALVCRETSGQLGVDVPGGRVVRSYDTLDLERPAAAPVVAAGDGAFEVRAWAAGDRMKPARLKGRSRKLSDLYIDAKVPRSSRASARVVIRRADQMIVWAEHIGFAFGESEHTVPVSMIAVCQTALPDRTGGTF